MIHASHRDESGLEDVGQFVEHAPVPIQRLAPDGTVLQANQALLDLLGYERARYVGLLFDDFHADPGVMTDMLATLTNREAVTDMPARLRCRDGSIREVLISSNAYWKDDQLVHTRCVIRDVTSARRPSAHCGRAKRSFE